VDPGSLAALSRGVAPRVTGRRQEYSWLMPVRRLPWQYLVFAALTIFGQLLLVWSSGSPIRPAPAGLTIFALLLVGLASGSILAWTLLAAWNTFMLAIVGGFVGGFAFAGSDFLLVALPIVFHISSLALLLSPRMRRHVGFGPRPPAHPA
jgi:hypothetical protein